ncbi:putative beta-1,4-xylosyltransferase IRX14H [Hibiscus syriacus]|uniref:Glycosyltransferases n=1 Tax=Hibiscus syriacus TaxID=106335 RepID=A0A6A3AQZ5_HIBSY|nr:beta-1,4-xylosyltransferase IRX14-like [Hibiscus syriacus]KAE8707044.1 putative beta-1,4-xylosyltransferase IRX14H [Hibiscus syriacus]
MKLSALQHNYLNRRSNSFRSSMPLNFSSDCAIKSPAGIFWLVLHGLSCLISLVLGFRFSRLVFLLFSTSSTNFYTSPFQSSSELAKTLDFHSVLLTNPVGNFPLPPLNNTATNSHVVVGRHGIRIRPWPHPNPVEVMKAHRIIERVQKEQRLQFGMKDPRKIIVVTPTYVRTFQALYMTSVMHALMLVPYDLVWIVVEAAGISNETASLIAKSGLKTIHIGFNQRMPNSWDERHKLESKMRLRALRIVREKKLDGIVMFADDSNMHSMELFDEIQNVKWIGAVSVGILANSANSDEMADQKKEEEENPPMLVQGPACNTSNMLAGWHTFNASPFAAKSSVYIDGGATMLPRMLEWSGFVLNSRLLWKDGDKLDWINGIDPLDADIENPLGLVKDPSVVEPLGSCGRQVLLWWLRVEARADSKFPSRWIIDPPLEITVPSKRTPWPDTLPELPSNGKPVTSLQEPTVKHTTKIQTFRSKRLSKRKDDEARADRRTEAF